MKFNQKIIIQSLKPILEENQKIKNKTTPHPFRFVKEFCQAHHISNKELRRYYRKWQEGHFQEEVFLPAQRDARPGSRRTPKEIELLLKLNYLIDGTDIGWDGTNIYIYGTEICFVESDTSGWQGFQYDLSSYVGSTIDLKISAWTFDEALPVYYYIDNISIAW